MFDSLRAMMIYEAISLKFKLRSWMNVGENFAPQFSFLVHDLELLSPRRQIVIDLRKSSETLLESWQSLLSRRTS